MDSKGSVMDETRVLSFDELGNPSQGIRDMNAFIDKKEWNLAASIAMIHGHEQCRIVGKDSWSVFIFDCE